MGHRTTPLVVILLLAAACGGREDAGARRAALDGERRELERMMDRLEDRLIVNQARVRFWGEMRVRHESVTAIACASQEEHAEEMARHLLPQERRRASARAADRVERVVATAPREGRAPAAAAAPRRKPVTSASN